MSDEIERARTGSLLEVEKILESLGQGRATTGEEREALRRTFGGVSRIRATRFGVKPLWRPEPEAEDGAVVNLAVEVLWRIGDIYDGPEVFAASIQVAPPFLQNLYAATWLRSEVCNGGFHQLFLEFDGRGDATRT